MIFTAYGHVLARDPPFPVYWEVTTLPGSTGTFKHAGTDVTRSVYQGASMTTELTADHRYWRRRILISTYMG
ncbi:MAG TPA: hypothetical protein PKO23_19770, partial [Candidatus Hydrogenedentes bacterium]|nr:hypothetical protein [Candidatus Hydrogenedentota bacterium]